MIKHKYIMEESLVVEKVIGIYFLFVVSIDTTVFWPLSYFLIDSSIPSEPFLIKSLFIALFASVYPIGKLISYKLSSICMHRFSFKATLMTLLTGSCIGITLIGIFPSFAGLFIGRFFSGLSSNSQVCVRKLLIKISEQEKSDWPSLSKKALWSNRLGALAGLLLSAFLSNPSFFLPQDSKFTQSRFFLLSLVVFLINISGLLLAFSIDTSSLEQFEERKYIELQEKKEQSDQTVVEAKNEEPVKEKFDFRRFIDVSGVIKEESIEESFNADDVKYYSPRHIANKPSCVKASLSARPEPSSGVQSAAETLEDHLPQNEVKKTHISFLEEDLEVIPKEVKEKIPDTPKNDSILKQNSGILKLRMGFSSISGVITESIPLILIVESQINDSFSVSMMLFVSYFTASVFKLCILDALCIRYSSFSIFFVALGGLTLSLFVFPVLAWFQVHLAVQMVLLSFLFTGLECTVPFSCILIADGTNYKDRQRALETNDMFSLLFKPFSNFLAVMSIFLIGSTFTFSFAASGLLAVFFYTLKVKNMFEFLMSAPYKI